MLAVALAENLGIVAGENGKALFPRALSEAGEGNRTLTTSLEGWGSTFELRPHAITIALQRGC